MVRNANHCPIGFVEGINLVCELFRSLSRISDTPAPKVE
jgi:hypothetical protein